MMQAPAHKDGLDGLRVLVTRPELQARPLCDLIVRAGGCPIRFPVLATAAVDDLAKAAAPLLHRQASYAWLVFVSANAVKYALRAFDGRMYIAKPVRVAAIGLATAGALARAGVHNVLTAPPPHDSEALLALPEMNDMNRRRCLIVRGEGGRMLLADTLRARGAEVDHAEVYRRFRPQADVASLLQRWRHGGVDITTVYSEEALHNLIAMLGDGGYDLLRSTPLIVVSSRLREKASAIGIRQVLQAKAASDAAMLEAIVNHAMRAHGLTLQHK
jgi:uroporphyrinogen-III synthase